MPKNAPRASPFDWLELKQFWYEISFRIGMNICFLNCTATSAWSISLIFKKKSNTVCSLSQHFLFSSASHVPFQGRQLPALASSLESLHLCGLEVIKSSISRHLSGSEIQDKSDHVPCPIRWSCDKTSQIRCFKTLCVLHHPGSCSSQDSGATRTMREPSILISLAGSAECTWLGHRSCHSELDMWKVFWHMHRMQQNCACFILIILEGSLNHYCCRYFPFCEICSLKKHCRAYVRTDSC